MSMPTKEKVKDVGMDAGTDDEGFPISGASTDDVTNTDAPTTAVKGGARPRPTYAAEKVTELPTDLTMPRSGPRTDPKMVEAFQVAVGDAGEWYCVATYQSANGAKTALKRIQEKKVTIPAGEWDLQARRIEAPESTDAAPVRWSKLYAKFMG